MNIHLITGNSGKYRSAVRAMEGTGITVVQKKLDIDEIQSFDVNEVSLRAAKDAFEIVKDNVAVTDAGFYITALNGFPGPFVKYTNSYFGSETLLKMLDGCSNREVVVRESLTLISKTYDIHQFCLETKLSLSNRISANKGTPIDKVLIVNENGDILADQPEYIQERFWDDHSPFILLCDHVMKNGISSLNL